MSVRALTWALDSIVGDKNSKLVLIALADFANENNECWPSQKRLASRAECSIDTVQRSLKKLETDGFISSVRQTQKHGYRSANLYTLAVPRQNRKQRSRPKPQLAASSVPQQGAVTRTTSSRFSSRVSKGLQDKGLEEDTRTREAADDEVPA